jgi:hypothetical protein
MNKHTLGPWFTEEYTYGDDVYDFTAVLAPKDVDGEGPVTICEIHNQANARLIAAAPDLLEALCTMAAVAAYLSAGESVDPAEIDSAFAKARAAIAKAEGKQ